MVCKLVNIASKTMIYSEYLKDFSPTGYFRDVDNIGEYHKKSTFLAFLNNEVAHEKSDLYR